MRSALHTQGHMTCIDADVITRKLWLVLTSIEGVKIDEQKSSVCHGIGVQYRFNEKNKFVGARTAATAVQHRRSLGSACTCEEMCARVWDTFSFRLRRRAWLLFISTRTLSAPPIFMPRTMPSPTPCSCHCSTKLQATQLDQPTAADKHSHKSYVEERSAETTSVLRCAHKLIPFGCDETTSI